MINLEGNRQIGTGICVALIAASVAMFFVFSAFRKYGSGTYEAEEDGLLIKKSAGKQKLLYEEIKKCHAEIITGGKKHGGVSFKMVMEITMKDGKVLRLFDYHIPDNEAQNPRSCSEVYESHRFVELDKFLNGKIANPC